MYVKRITQKLFNMKILIVDVGYGGLLISSLLHEKIKKDFSNKEYKLIFYPLKYDTSSNIIYNNHMYYSKKLQQVITHLNPNIVILACNSLSINNLNVKKDINIVNIAKLNAQYMINTIDKRNDTAIIYFGSPTTVESKYYDNILTKNMYNCDNIFGIPCSGLANIIELGDIGKIRFYIYSYVKQVYNLLDKDYNKIYIALCCTHYEYVTNIFIDAFKYFKISNYIILDLASNSINEISKILPKNNVKYIYTNKFYINKLENINPQIKKTLSNYVSKYSTDISDFLSK